MPTLDPRIDVYIATVAPFAQPILAHLREVVHAACPTIVEAMKWGRPHFMYRDRILCGMSAFKQHAAFGFWAGADFVDETGKSAAMGQFGRITKVTDLPARKALIGYVKEAMRRADEQVNAAPAKRAPARAPMAVPPDLAAALKSNAAASRTFEGFPPSQRHEYIEWLVEAKRPETRARRLAQTLEQLAAGKTRHWKYANC